jgi:OFA family oxalate/formate antiporter-like MFS transporter
MQLVFTTSSFTFCFVIILGGRLYDRWGPRPLAVISALMMAAGWFLASRSGSNWFLLWLGAGLLGGGGSAMGYVCPVATAITWFPKRAGLIAGLAAAGFGLGPMLLSNTVEYLLRHQWPVLGCFGFVASVWPPVVLVTGLLLSLPAGHPVQRSEGAFQRRSLLGDRRFWALFAGMFFGTLPYLVVMGAVKPLGAAFAIGPAAAAMAISTVALGNAVGRITWGQAVDRLGPRTAMIAAPSLMFAGVLTLILAGRLHAGLFLGSVSLIGFCYGSNFAIYPSTVVRLYGVGVFGSVYPFIMAAQGFSSLAPTFNGMLHDRTGSYIPGLVMAALLGAVGILTVTLLMRTESLGPVRERSR